MNIEARFRGAGPADRDLRPIVPVPRNNLPGAAIAMFAVILAVALFLYLNGRRNAAARASQQPEVIESAAFAAPPPLVLPQLQPAPQIVTLAPAPPLMNTPASQSSPARSAPPLLTNGGPFSAPSGTAPSFYPPAAISPFPPPPPLPPPASPGLTEPALLDDSAAGTTQPAQDEGATGPTSRLSSAPSPASRLNGAPVRATKLSNRASVMPTGTIIQAVLETPIDTSRTGFVRAIVSQDARGFNGRRVLVPRGSRLIGEFRADMRPGAKRVLVNWNRLVRADGVVIQLDSPAADPQGGPGIPATVHGSSLGRIIGSAFQSALYFGSSLLGGRMGTTVVISSPTGSAAGAMAQAFTPGMEQAPRLTVREGTLVNVFVAHDLDFSSGSSGRQQ